MCERYCGRGIIAVALLWGTIATCLSDTPINEGVTVQCTINQGSEQSFVVSTLVDWQYYQFTFTITSNGAQLNEPIASVTISCAEASKTRNVYPSSLLEIFHRESMCSTFTTKIVIKNLLNEEISASIVVQRMDDSLLSLQMSETVNGTISGYSTDSIHTYRLYISDYEGQVTKVDAESSDMIDMLRLTLECDSLPHLTAYVSNSPRPLNRHRQPFLLEASSKASFMMDRTSVLFSANRDLFIHLIVENVTSSLIPFSLSSNVAFSSALFPDSTDEYIFDTGANCTILDSLEPVRGFLILDFSTKVLYDDFSLMFSILDYDGEVKVTLSDRTFREEFDDRNQQSFQGSNPLKIDIPLNSSFYHLRYPIYIQIQPMDETSMQFCRYAASMLYQQHATVHVAKYNSLVSITTPSKPSITYHAVWIPNDDLGTLVQTDISFHNVSYHWIGNGTVATPLTIYYGYGDSPSALNIADSSIQYTSSFTYQPYISITATRVSVGCYLLVAVVSEGECSWSFQGGVKVDPFLLTPSNSIKGALSSFHDYVDSYIFLYSTTYTEITLSASKLSTDYRSLALYVSIDEYPDRDHYDWMQELPASEKAMQVNVTISRSHPRYCNKCKYYMKVVMEGASELSTNNTQLEILFYCPGDVCSNCMEGRDPAQNCQECLEGFYGTNCSPCRNCHHGTCSDGQSGDGSCQCDVGFTSYSNCTECKSGFYGLDCTACESCNSHGSCVDGLQGNGTCICEEGFDHNQRCGDCIAGRFGESCNDTCPGQNNICSNNGVCDDGIQGTGRCECNEGYVECDTLYENDRCNPHCYAEYGACDEELGVCICWDNHTGVDCNFSREESVSLIMFLIMLVIVSVISFLFIVRVKQLSKKKKDKSQVKKKVIVDADRRFISWRVAN